MFGIKNNFIYFSYINPIIRNILKTKIFIINGIDSIQQVSQDYYNLNINTNLVLDFAEQNQIHKVNPKAASLDDIPNAVQAASFALEDFVVNDYSIEKRQGYNITKLIDLNKFEYSEISIKYKSLYLKSKNNIFIYYIIGDVLHKYILITNLDTIFHENYFYLVDNFNALVINLSNFDIKQINYYNTKLLYNGIHSNTFPVVDSFKKSDDEKYLLLYFNNETYSYFIENNKLINLYLVNHLKKYYVLKKYFYYKYVIISSLNSIIILDRNRYYNINLPVELQSNSISDSRNKVEINPGIKIESYLLNIFIIGTNNFNIVLDYIDCIIVFYNINIDLLIKDGIFNQVDNYIIYNKLDISPISKIIGNIIILENDKILYYIESLKLIDDTDTYINISRKRIKSANVTF